MRVSEALVSPADATARIAALEASLARANAALAARDLLIDTLRGQIARLRRMQFGASSEKLGREIEQLELALKELEAERDAPGPEATDPGGATRPAPVRSLPGHLPREEVVHEPVSGACTCPDCGGALRPLGSDAHEMLDIVPVHWRVVRNIRPKYSCRSCDKIVQAPAPVSAVARGKATFATLAHIVVSKFDHHLPLYRQAEMMAAQGLDIDRSTLAGWTGQAAALLDPIVSRIRDEVLKADKIHADDTPVPVLDPGRGKTATGRLWVYATDDQASGGTAPRATWYRFTPDRTAAHPMAHLAGFRGFLQADAYAGYDGLYRGGATEVACWAHFRRKVFDLHERSPTPLSTDILERIGALYAVEAEVRGQPPDIRCCVRQERSKPLVEALHEVLDASLRRLSPRSDMAKACRYGTKRWPALSRFLDDGRLEIDNNIAERALRGVAVGRRNWLFAGSRAGGERAAAIYTVIQTCKANGVDPQAYIADVIARVAGDWPASRWDELMPWNWSPEPARLAA
ncbi:IS66 family transposase [Sphingomonas sp. Leaf10]|uniref:IS66 family transposase n=1 Tax=Sphingomonas sp. Leaf10 TaxID=1735676 RepID=UPI0006FFDBC4|nr:IS66 family transposase [Sphingomonas sp. Leaf10]KQM34485.1 transposase [Sphingomonas sp. Leaf10]